MIKKIKKPLSDPKKLSFKIHFTIILIIIILLIISIINYKIFGFDELKDIYNPKNTSFII